MPSSTLIELPLHVNSQYLMQVVGKVVGEKSVFHAFPENRTVVSRNNRSAYTTETPKTFDSQQPSSKENPWHLKFTQQGKSLALKVSESGGMSHGNLHFMDVSGHHHGWFFHAEDEHERCKTLRPGSHGFAVAVGARLVKFFGGSLIPYDGNDVVSLKVSNAQARFPKKLLTQSSDDRWYQFYNTLHAEPLLTAKELMVAIEKHGAGSEHLALLEYIQKLEFKQQLEQNVSPSSAPDRPGPRL